MQATIDEGNNEWVVFVDFLLCGCLWETITAKGEFNVVEFDVGVRFSGKGLVGLEAFYEKNRKRDG